MLYNHEILKWKNRYFFDLSLCDDPARTEGSRAVRYLWACSLSALAEPGQTGCCRAGGAQSASQTLCCSLGCHGIHVVCWFLTTGQWFFRAACNDCRFSVTYNSPRTTLLPIFFFLLCCICQGKICSLWKREVIFSWLTFLYNYLALMCPRPCRISILLLLIALPHPEHVHLQELPSICEQGQPQSQQEDSIMHVLKCLQAPKLRFSQAISDVVCLSFDASFNTF